MGQICYVNPSDKRPDLILWPTKLIEHIGFRGLIGLREPNNFRNYQHSLPRLFATLRLFFVPLADIYFTMREAYRYIITLCVVALVATTSVVAQSLPKAVSDSICHALQRMETLISPSTAHATPCLISMENAGISMESSTPALPCAKPS